MWCVFVVGGLVGVVRVCGERWILMVYFCGAASYWRCAAEVCSGWVVEITFHWRPNKTKTSLLKNRLTNK